MNMASQHLLSLSEKLVTAADCEQWEEVTRLQKIIHESLEARDALKIYARKTLELVQEAIQKATESTMQRRDEIKALVHILSQ
jgi:tryptophan 2,3-dioxygenase